MLRIFFLKKIKKYFSRGIRHQGARGYTIDFIDFFSALNDLQLLKMG
jgi:hypothetical protein